MMKSKIRTLAVTGITTMAAAIVTLSTTAASAASTTAPGHAAAPTGCVTQTFTTADANTYEICVRDEQVLLNNLWSISLFSGLQQLRVDGHYGDHTYNDVRSFQSGVGISVDGKTDPQTWYYLCANNWLNGFTGDYWHDAGCNTEPGLASTAVKPTGKRLTNGDGSEASGPRATAFQSASGASAASASVPTCGGTSLRVGVGGNEIRVPTVGNDTPGKWGCNLLPSSVAGLIPVERLQIDLNDCYSKQLGFSPLTVDGEYGTNTETAVRKVQAYEGVTQDGDYGPQTIEGSTAAARPFAYQESGEPTGFCDEIVS